MTRVKDPVSSFSYHVSIKKHDILDFSSRLVFRTAGTQRVALNTQIWGGMSVEQCSEKVNIFAWYVPLISNSDVVEYKDISTRYINR